jgi:hypothetical protein
MMYLEENAGAAAQIGLTPKEVAELEGVVPADRTVGDRYGRANMKAINADKPVMRPGGSLR